MGYAGQIWPVHPKAKEVAGHPAYARLEDLPAAPDAVFIGINRHATIEAVQVLSRMGAGGAVCFASGYSEAAAEDYTGGALQDQLIHAAGEIAHSGTQLLWLHQRAGRRVALAGSARGNIG